MSRTTKVCAWVLAGCLTVAVADLLPWDHFERTSPHGMVPSAEMMAVLTSSHCYVVYLPEHPDRRIVTSGGVWVDERGTWFLTFADCQERGWQTTLNLYRGPCTVVDLSPTLPAPKQN